MSRRAMHPLVFRLFVVYCVVTSSVRVFFRRLFLGPAEPSWSLPFEVGVDVERRFMKNGFDEAKHGLAISDAPVPRDPRVASRVSLRRGELGGLETEVHTPRGWQEGDATLLYWHGGGYISCSPRTHRDLVSRIAHHSRARCVVPNYRKAPAHPYPTALDSAVECFHALLASGIDPNALFFGGDSAGGGLALALALRLRDAGSPTPRALVLLSPWVDLTGSGASVREAHLDILTAEMIASGSALYAGDAPLDHPHISPLHADLTGLPPLLVQTGEREVFYSENLTFVDRARAAGVTVTHEVSPGMVHVFQTLAFLNARSHAALRSIGSFVRSHRDHAEVTAC